MPSNPEVAAERAKRRRADKAKAEGRAPGVNGRPRKSSRGPVCNETPNLTSVKELGGDLLLDVFPGVTDEAHNAVLQICRGDVEAAYNMLQEAEEAEIENGIRTPAKAGQSPGVRGVRQCWQTVHGETSSRFIDYGWRRLEEEEESAPAGKGVPVVHSTVVGIPVGPRYLPSCMRGPCWWVLLTVATFLGLSSMLAFGYARTFPVCHLPTGPEASWGPRARKS